MQNPWTYQNPGVLALYIEELAVAHLLINKGETAYEISSMHRHT